MLLTCRFFAFQGPMDFSNLQNHPDVDEIVSKLLSGIDPSDVVDLLKLRYPEMDQNHLRLNLRLLKEFMASPYLDYYKQVEQDLIAVKHKKKIDKKIAQSLLNNKTYQERLNEVLDEKIELSNRFKELDVLFRSRMEQVFDAIQSDPGQVNGKTDYVLIKYAEQYLNLLDKYNRNVNNKPDQVVQHNVAVVHVDQYAFAIQEAIRGVLAEMDPAFSLIFVDKLSKKLSEMNLDDLSKLSPTPEPVAPKALLEEIKTLETHLLQVN